MRVNERVAISQPKEARRIHDYLFEAFLFLCAQEQDVAIEYVDWNPDASL